MVLKFWAVNFNHFVFLGQKLSELLEGICLDPAPLAKYLRKSKYIFSYIPTKYKEMNKHFNELHPYFFWNTVKLIFLHRIVYVEALHHIQPSWRVVYAPFTAGPFALDLQRCPQRSFQTCPAEGATAVLQWPPSEQPALPPTSWLCPPPSSPPHPAGCAGLSVPDRCLTAQPEVAGQTPVLPPCSQSGEAGLQRMSRRDGSW